MIKKQACWGNSTYQIAPTGTKIIQHFKTSQIENKSDVQQGNKMKRNEVEQKQGGKAVPSKFRKTWILLNKLHPSLLEK